MHDKNMIHQSNSLTHSSLNNYTCQFLRFLNRDVQNLEQPIRDQAGTPSRRCLLIRCLICRTYGLHEFLLRLDKGFSAALFIVVTFVLCPAPFDLISVPSLTTDATPLVETELVMLRCLTESNFQSAVLR